MTKKVFNSMMVGILLYAAVIGFFNDYTDLISTKSYSTTFFVAIVMQLLTYATFKVKDSVVSLHKKKEGRNKLYLIFGVWFVMFSSKFVFLAVIDKLFGSNVEIKGFIALLIIIITFTVLQKLIDLLEKRLPN